MTGLFRTACAAVALALTLFAAQPAAAQARGISFGPGSPKALLVVASPPLSLPTNTSFRRVDLAGGTFLRAAPVFNARVGGNGAGGGGVFLDVREVDPGDYALVRLLAIRPGPTVWTCMPEGAPVFSLRAGEIAVIRTDDWWWGFQAPGLPDPGDVSDDAVLRQVEDLRAANPGLTAEARLVRPSATIQWSNPGRVTRDCVRSPTFSRLG